MTRSRRMFVKVGTVAATGIVLGRRLVLFSRRSSVSRTQLALVRNTEGFWFFLPDMVGSGVLRRDTISDVLVFDRTVPTGITPIRLTSGYIGFV